MGFAVFRPFFRLKAMRWLFAIFFISVFPVELLAHERRPAIATATIQQDGSFELVISLNLEAIMAGIEADHADTKDSAQAPVYDELRAHTPDILRQKFSAFASRLEGGISLGNGEQTNGRLITLGVTIPPVGDLEEPRLSEILFSGKLPDRADKVFWSFDPAFGDSVIRLRMADDLELFHSQYVSGAVSSSIPIDSRIKRSPASHFAEYLWLGFVHIIPKGLDHILFIVGLFLLSTRTSVLLWQITTFTVAHTITLALGSIGVVQLSPAIVEPLIALSIVYVAVENLLTTRLTVWRPLLIFGFGLLHGLGFADVLGQIGLTAGSFAVGLIAFNVGVELGQISVIAACMLVVGWAMNRPMYRQVVVLPTSLAIALIAAFWSIERALT